MEQQVCDKVDRISLGVLFPELRLSAPVCDVLVREVSLDSRRVQAGDLFVALKGAKTNAEVFIDDVILLGVVAVAVESSTYFPAGSVELRGEVFIIAVDKLAERVSFLAALCLGMPSKKLRVVGVTGTNGKSTCVSLIAQLHNFVLGKAASMGTLGLEYQGKNLVDFAMTTPDAATCQKSISLLVEQGADLIAMEVSSHGLEQNRVAAVEFDVAVFTNLTHDHLDYHGTVKRYREAKRKLFKKADLKIAVINLDDPYSQQMVAAAKKNATIFTYSILHFVADIYATNIEYSSDGAQFSLVSPWGSCEVKSPLLGQFNVYNLLAAVAALCATGTDFDQVIEAIDRLESVPGRMQKAYIQSDINVVVDYAHTPDALEQAIGATKTYTEGQLYVVFGCGGDRDAFKRPSMAKVAENLSDHVVVTSDNPRTEDLDLIIEDICAGFTKSTYQVIPDRKEAIDYAISHAKPTDTVLIAGKGHEKYQIIGDQKFDFDDMAIAEQALSVRIKNRHHGMPL